MSSLWTPGGEHRVPGPDGSPSAAPPPDAARTSPTAGPTGGPTSPTGPSDSGGAGGSDRPGGSGDPGTGPDDVTDLPPEDFSPEDLSPEEQVRLAEAADEIAAVRAQLASAPPEQVVANHLIGLYELAAIHLGQSTPNLPAARLAIDALAAVLDACKGRLGEVEATLGAARSQIQMAYVGVANRGDASADTEN
jgi:hypothetical protein